MASSSSGGGQEGGEEGDRQRRYPSTLDGIFKFCVENTKSEDAPGTAEGGTSAMTEERRQFLEAALSSMETNDPIKCMVESIQVLLTAGNDEEEVEKKETVLEDLQEMVEDMDLATDFHKVGGLAVLSNLLHSDHEGLRWRTADLIATLVQNHPYCQQEVLNANFLPMLLNALDTDSSSLVRTKCLYAVSCLTRDVPAAQEQFVSLDGFSVLMRAMQGEEEKLQTKAAFMLGVMCVSQPKCKDLLCDMGMVEQLVGLLHGEHKGFHEHLIGALLKLARDHPRSIAECKRTELGLKANLEERLRTLKGQPEYEEELEYSQQLLELCFGSGIAVSSVDR